MNAADLKGKTIGFLASGGLDSCTITHWLTQLGVRVVALTADLGQPDETNLDDVRQRMLAAGAAEAVIVDAKAALAEAGLGLIQAQAKYEDGYWNTTGIARPVTVQAVLPELQKRGIKVLSHGATGRGNDQVRFQLCTNMLAPDTAVYAPWRDELFLARFRGRAEMIDYCQSQQVPIRASKSKPYSTDANLLGLTHEAGKLEDLATPSDFVKPEFGVLPQDAPDQPEIFKVRFAAGRPVMVNDAPVSVLAAFNMANKIGGRNAIGINLHLVENRFVGVKSRGIYEQPGIELLGRCYNYLMQVTLDRRARELFDYLSGCVAKQVYQAFSLDLASQMAAAAVGRCAEIISGTVKVSLYKGNISYAAIEDAPQGIYSSEDSSMEAVGGFNHADSEGLLRVLGVSARALAHAGQIRS